MRKIIAFLIVGFLSTPVSSFAQGVDGSCSGSGYTIATVNGVFTNKEQAEVNMIALRNAFGVTSHGENINFQYFHNESHLAGVGDIAKTLKQMIEGGTTTDDFDLVEMLRDASEKVTTRKLLIVAHSQGNFYANAFYKRATAPSSGDCCRIQ